MYVMQGKSACNEIYVMQGKSACIAPGKKFFRGCKDRIGKEECDQKDKIMILTRS